MAQFDVYQNPSKNTRNAFPYLLDIQNPVISDIATRIVIPLGRLQSFNNKSMHNLTPEIEYNGEKYLLLTPQIASIPSKILKAPIGSLNHFRNEIIAAIDFAITGI
ncbi:toxin CcdB [Zhongshania antarctica]|uniref:Toxin CcdB n=1 Tax=Zhongshania antarctica TaxID=641702 RepID=A0A840R2Q4_9GAMM|nr:CcdB family protein [Zhongshania antarctica]MBB5186918.1 toxin CcdB [Zhongshania antarctica]